MPRRKICNLISLLLLAAMLATAPSVWPAGTGAGGMALADDDGGDSDSDDGDDDGRSSHSSRSGSYGQGGERRDDRRILRKSAPRDAARSPRRDRPARQALPVFAPEIVANDLSGEDLATLLAEGFLVIERLTLPDLGADISRIAPPPGVELAVARSRVRALTTGVSADFNHYYRPEQQGAGQQGAERGIQPASAPPARPAVAGAACRHGNCRFHDLVGWPDAGTRAANCPITQEIGVIDTGVNDGHELLTAARLSVTRMTPAEVDASAKIHGTAVLSVLAGTPGSRVEGLLPEAQYVAADIFARDGQDDRADVVTLLRGLDLLERRGVRVINLSLAGPENTVLERMIRKLIDERRTVLVAAVGNGGPGLPVAFPAAYDGVIAVTAVDARGRAYRSAQRGARVDIAAPGVGLLLATSVKGAREQTGTSFAVPFVTAAAALVLSREPDLAPADVAARLFAAAQDAGASGKDDIFGHGMLEAGALCP